MGAAEEEDSFDVGDLEAHRRKLRAFVGRRVSDAAAADDIIQATLERAWRYRHSYDGERDLGGWVTGIARNQIVDHFKASERGEIPVADVPLSRDTDAELAFERIEVRESYPEMVDWLSDRDDVSETCLHVGVLAMTGKNVTETAFELGVSRETVRLHRKALQGVLREHPGIRQQLGI